MSLGIPFTPAFNATTSILTPVGPAPTGRSTAVVTPISQPPSNPSNQSENQSESYIGFNYPPKPLAAPYDQLTYQQGLQVFINTNFTRMHRDGPRRPLGESVPGVTPYPILGINALNLMSRDVAGVANENVRLLRQSGARRDPNAVDPLMMFEMPEAALQPMIERVARKGLQDSSANLLLTWTLAGQRQTYNYLGTVVVENYGAPPAMGGKVNPAFSLNVARHGVLRQPIPNVWAAEKGDHCYFIRKWYSIPGEPNFVATIPYKTKEPFIPELELLCDGHFCQERGEAIYLGPAVDSHGEVNEETRAKAVGLHPQASVKASEAAMQSLPGIDIDFFDNHRVTV